MKEPKKYSSPVAMRTALEDRINRNARETNQDIQRLRRQVAFDRLLARVFSSQQASRFALKGGLGDFFEFIVGESILDLENAVYGGYRYPIECRMAGRRFAQFNIDIAAGDVWLDTHKELAGNQWLEFAGISAPKIPTISAEQQFAEKIHSYSLPRQTPNSRTKDLVDLVLLIEKCSLDAPRLRDALEKTFKRRKTHEIPKELANPPETWKEQFKNMAEECGISNDLDSAIIKVRNFYNNLFTLVQNRF